MKNKYARHFKIPEAQIRQIVRLFPLDLTALQFAAVSSINRNTASRCLPAFRGRTARSCGAESPVRRMGCAEAPAPHSRDLVGLLRREGKIYTQVVPDDVKAALQRPARRRLSADTVSRVECGASFNHRQEDISPLMLRLLRTDSLS